MKNRIWTILIPAVIVVVLPYIYLWSKVSPLVLSTDPSELDHFAGFVSGIASPFLSIMSIAVTIYIAVVLSHGVRASEKEEKKVAHLIDMNRYWNSESMYKCRGEGFKTLKKYDMPLEEIDSQHHDEAGAISVVQGFFQDLQLSVDRGAITEKDAIECFGRLFIWWDTASLRHSPTHEYPERWQNYGRLKTLRDSITRTYPKETINKWKSEVETDLKNLRIS
jgi:hypothetical protein